MGKTVDGGWAAVEGGMPLCTVGVPWRVGTWPIDGVPCIVGIWLGMGWFARRGRPNPSRAARRRRSSSSSFSSTGPKIRGDGVSGIGLLRKVSALLSTAMVGRSAFGSCSKWLVGSSPKDVPWSDVLEAMRPQLPQKLASSGKVAPQNSHSFMEL